MDFLISPTISDELFNTLAKLDILNQPKSSLARLDNDLDVFQIPWRSEFGIVDRIMDEARPTIKELESAPMTCVPTALLVGPRGFFDSKARLVIIVKQETGTEVDLMWAGKRHSEVLTQVSIMNGCVGIDVKSVDYMACLCIRCYLRPQYLEKFGLDSWPAEQ